MRTIPQLLSFFKIDAMLFSIQKALCLIVFELWSLYRIVWRIQSQIKRVIGTNSILKFSIIHIKSPHMR